MKVVLPVAGLGSRLKPHTFTTPKPLLEVGGKVILAHIIDKVLELNPSELIFITGHHKEKIESFVRENYGHITLRFVEQTSLDGSGSAVYCGIEKYREDEDVLVFFGDILIDFDLKASLEKVSSHGLIYTKEVESPEHYGIVVTNSLGEIIESQEKPEVPKSNQAIIGAYWFKSLLEVKSILAEKIEKNEKIRGEFNIMQVILEYIERKDRSVKSYGVDAWYDCGRVEVLLEANAYFLQKNSLESKEKLRGTSVIIPPCYVSKDAHVESCVIGPYVSVAEGVSLKNSVISNSIISKDSTIEHVVAKDSLVAPKVIFKYKEKSLNLGENSIFIM